MPCQQVSGWTPRFAAAAGGGGAAAGPLADQAFHLLLFGVVQGVGFRLFAQREAVRGQVRGWVRNRDDGTVEVWAEGAAQRLADFLDQLRRGPIGAEVRDWQIEWTTPTGRCTSFHIRD